MNREDELFKKITGLDSIVKPKTLAIEDMDLEDKNIIEEEKEKENREDELFRKITGLDSIVLSKDSNIESKEKKTISLSKSKDLKKSFKERLKPPFDFDSKRKKEINPQLIEAPGFGKQPQREFQSTERTRKEVLGLGMGPVRPELVPRNVPFQDTQIKEQKEEPITKDPKIWRNLKTQISKPFTKSKKEQETRTDVVLNVSKYLKEEKNVELPYEYIDKNLDAITKELEIRNYPTTQELIGLAFTGVVATGLLTTTVPTVIGLLGFMSLAETENLVISLIKKEPYKFLGNKGFKDLLPRQANEVTKDVVEIVDFLWKAKAFKALKAKAPSVIEKYTKDIITRYKLPENVYIEAKKIKSIFKTGKEISKEELALVEQLGLNGKEYRAAIKNGVAIEVPLQLITTKIDKPFWAKIKNSLHIKTSKPIITSKYVKDKPFIGPRGLLEEGVTKPAPIIIAETGAKTPVKPVTPTVVPKISVAKPTLVPHVSPTKVPPKTITPKDGIISPISGESEPKGIKNGEVILNEETLKGLSPTKRIESIKETLGKYGKTYILDEGGENLSKVSIPSRGFILKKYESKTELLYGTYNKGYVTDSYSAILDKEISQGILDDFYLKEAKKDLRNLLKIDPTLDKEKTLQHLMDGIMKNVNDKTLKAPNINDVIPKKYSKEEAFIQGYEEYRSQDGLLAILTNKIDQISVSADKLAWIKKQLPDAKMYLSGKDSVVVFEQNEKVTGLLMPIFDSKPFIPKIETKSKVQAVKEVKPIPKELEPLVKEAREYKSAEEFIEVNQGTLYRGTTSEEIGLIPREGLSVTLDPGQAKKYAKSRGLAGFVDEQYIKINAKTIKLSDIPNEVRGLEEGSDFAGKSAIWARKQGYDVLDMTAGNEVEMRILNKDILISRKLRTSQLTDIYNQAVEEVKPIAKPKVKPKKIKPKTVKEKIEEKKKGDKAIIKANIESKKPTKVEGPKEKILTKKEILAEKVRKEKEIDDWAKKQIADFNEGQGEGVEVDIPKEVIDDIIETTNKEIKDRPSLGQGFKVGENLYLQESKMMPFDLEATTKDKINKTIIMAWMEKAFKVPIRGKATHRWKAAGVYYPKAALIRLGKWGELAVASHELSHHIDATLKKSIGKGWKETLSKLSREELKALDYDPSAKRVFEGFAEFMRHDLTTGRAKELAPNFYEEWTTLIKDTKLKKNLDTLRNMMDTWKKQGAENRILQHIDFKGEHQRRGFLSKVERAKGWLMKNFNDEFYYPQKIVKAVEEITGKELRPTQNPAKMLEYSKAKSGAIAKTFILKKAIDETGKVVGPGLQEVLEPISPKDMKRFIAYAVSKRALSKEARGIESGYDVEDVKYFINKNKNNEWDKVVSELTKWSGHLMDWVFRAGGITGKEKQLMELMNPIYIPFKRAFIDELSITRGGAKLANMGKPLKRMKGSGRPVINPIESLISQATEMIAKAQKIHIARLFANLADEAGVGGFIKKVPAPQKPITLSKDKLLTAFKNMDVDLYALENMDDFLTVFAQDWSYKGKDNIVSFWKDGKRVFHELHPELYKALLGVDMVHRGKLLKVMAPFARLTRLGATQIKFSFGLIRNPIRDTKSYLAFSKRLTATPWDPIRGGYRAITAKEGEVPWRFRAAGGELAGQIGLDRSSTMAAYDEMMLSKLGPKGKALKVFKHPIDTLRMAFVIPELGPRTAEVEGMYKHYRKTEPTWTEEDCFVQAFLDGQDVTVNFTKSGHIAKKINEAIAFFNVAIRGPEKLVRSFKERPVQTFVKGLLWITIPAVLNWLTNKDKQWYKNLPYAYKYNNMWYEDGDSIYRLPIPFELGILFASVPMAALDASQSKDLKPFKGIEELAKMQIPPVVPSAIGPYYDVQRNKNWMGAPIETEGMQYLYPTERTKYYTSSMAKSFSKMFDNFGISISPVQLDYLFNQYSGGMIKQFAPREIREPADIPVLGDITLRMPKKPSRQLNQYFFDFEVLTQREKSGLLTSEERRKLNKIKPFYQKYLTHSDIIIKANEDNDLEKMARVYEKLGKMLSKIGYE